MLRVAVPSVLAVLLGACGSHPVEPTVADPSLDADAVEFDAGAVDVPDLPDAGGPADVLEVDLEADVPLPDVVLPEVIDLSCVSDETCQTSCGRGTCIGGLCVFDLNRACVIPEDGRGRCVAAGAVDETSGCLVCRPAVRPMGWTGALAEADFNVSLGGFEVETLGEPSATWSIQTARAAQGQASLYFGNPDARSYGVDSAGGSGRAWGRARSAPLTVPMGGAELRFALWLDTEQTAGFDYLRVLAADEDEGSEVEVWHSDAIGGTTDGAWRSVVVDLAPVADSRVRLVLEFDTLDDVINDFEGAYVDVLRVRTGCCAETAAETAADCDDGDPCTSELCDRGSCVQQPAPDATACCVDASSCDDGDACTADSCSGYGGSCGAEPIPGCCTDATDCNDDDPCTLDTCPEPGGGCRHVALCCQDDAHCEDGNPCTGGRCVSGECAYEALCCDTDVDCADDDACTLDRCVAGFCEATLAPLPGCCAPLISRERFDAGLPPGWNVSPLDQGVGWQVATIGKAHSQPGALYYGNPATLNYTTGGRNLGVATSGGVTLPADSRVSLSFWAWLEVEQSLFFDRLLVSARAQDESLLLTDKSPMLQPGWNPVSVDLTPLAGRTISLSFSFDSYGPHDNDGLGVLIDDLEVTSTCAPAACELNADCDPFDACWVGSCLEGGCVYANICCSAAADCDDGRLCTVDSCADDGQCEHAVVPSCCEGDLECNDGDPCTTDSCPSLGGTCAHTHKPSCCVGFEDCDDGDPCTEEDCAAFTCSWSYVCCQADADCIDAAGACTTDLCVEGRCYNLQEGGRQEGGRQEGGRQDGGQQDGDGCCQTTVLVWDFETPVELEVSQTSPPCTWSVGELGPAISGTSVLYYGDISQANFDCGVNAGTVRGPWLSLLPGVEYLLGFNAFVDTETSLGFDKLWVRAELADGTELTLWSKGELGDFSAWTAHVVDISALAGRTFRVALTFDSDDGTGNTGLGVLIDDLAIGSTCATRTCSTASDCYDGLSGTVDSCVAGACSWEL